MNQVLVHTKHSHDTICFYISVQFTWLLFLQRHLEEFHLSDPCFGFDQLGNYRKLIPHCGTLAWKIPWLEEPGGLQSMGSLGVGHDWATSLSLFPFTNWRRKWQPTPVFLPGESQGWGAWWAAVYGVAQSRTRLKRLSNSRKLMHLVI